MAARFDDEGTECGDNARREVIVRRGRDVVSAEASALGILADNLDDSFVVACETICNVQRQLVVSGMGKSGHVAQKIAATFSATGTPAIYVHPAEAGHGDLGMICPEDVLLVFSNSGETAELRPMLSYARRIGVTTIGVVSRPGSLVMEQADVAVRLPSLREACPFNVAPTTSTALQLALGDALALTVMDIKGIPASRLRLLHPSGSIGLRLADIGEMMHTGALPLVREEAPMHEVIACMTQGSFGLSGVVDAGNRLVGIITDGDLRRHFAVLASARASEVMTRNPRTIALDRTAADGLSYLNEHQITAAFVVDPDDRAGPQVPIGIVHIHDLLRFGLN